MALEVPVVEVVPKNRVASNASAGDMSYNTPVGGAFTMSMTEDLYAFGIKVDVQPPSSSQVLDLSALTHG